MYYPLVLDDLSGIGRQVQGDNTHAKLAMDFFSRQRAVPDWHQPLIEQQRALLLGVGGIGCTVAKELWCARPLTVLAILSNL